MKKWVRSGKCNRECFANHNGECGALAETPKTGECPFRRTDISMKKQYADIALHNSRKSHKDYEVGIDG